MKMNCLMFESSIPLLRLLYLSHTHTHTHTVGVTSGSTTHTPLRTQQQADVDDGH
jgi:hypothetical protein